MKKEKVLKIITIFFLILLTSCKGIVFENQKTAKAEEFTKGEAMIFVVEEKNKYENKFGANVWNLKSGDGDKNFKDYVVNNVKKFVEKIMKLKLIANELNIIIGNSDLEKIAKASKEYEESLTESDLYYIDCNSNDIVKAFTDFHTARLVVDNISKGVTTELSISESKVIKVQYIVLRALDDAKKVQESLSAKGASFSYFAKTRSIENNIDMIIQRGDEMSLKFPELFYLSTGQISEILVSENKYYIFKCINDYMVEETEDRRISILKTMKNDAFNENYKKYDDEYHLGSNSAYWKDINLSDGFACTIHKFEEIYYKYFPKSIV